jgi:hypothetical protein
VAETGGNEVLRSPAAVAASGLTPRVAGSDERNATVIIGTMPTLAGPARAAADRY